MAVKNLAWEQEKASVPQGRKCYTGFSATMWVDGFMVCVVGETLNGLKAAWNRVAVHSSYGPIPINESMTERVAVFSEGQIVRSIPDPGATT